MKAARDIAIVGRSALTALTAFTALACAPAWAVNKCVVDGRVVYQDAPCVEARETVEQGMKRQELQERQDRLDRLQREDRIAAYHRRLDQMQARGVGLAQRAPPTPAPPRAEVDAPPRLGSVRQSPAQREAADAGLTAQTMARNEKSRQALVQQLEAATASCGAKLPDLPVVGMGDETFRNCTLHARYGGMTQVVAVEDDGVPLRLYVFPPGRAERVYSVDGVVTLVKP